MAGHADTVHADAIGPCVDQRVELRARGLDVHAVFQSAGDREEVTGAIPAIGRVDANRQPHLRLMIHQVDAGRKNPDDLARHAFDVDATAHNRLSSERRLPEFVREDGDGSCAWRGLTRSDRRQRADRFAAREQATLGRLDAKRSEEVLVNGCRANAVGLSAVEQADLADMERADVRKRLIELAELEVLDRRYPE
jgi:hypothetical protein